MSEAATETVALHAAEVDAGVFLLGWVEESGMTVTHVMNLDTLPVHALWTYDNDGRRAAELQMIASR
ncbi:MoaF-related domain-containing protein [Streptomyces ipomoeae]|uniref:MoaF-related domain-containing protein n=1 Tax=Streptomyces ipomoeae TaxID=103232 RepID=UPI0038D4C059